MTPRNDHSRHHRPAADAGEAPPRSRARLALQVLGHLVLIGFWLWAGIQIGRLVWQLLA